MLSTAVAAVLVYALIDANKYAEIPQTRKFNRLGHCTDAKYAQTPEQNVPMNSTDAEIFQTPSEGQDLHFWDLNAKKMQGASLFASFSHLNARNTLKQQKCIPRILLT